MQPYVVLAMRCAQKRSNRDERSRSIRARATKRTRGSVALGSGTRPTRSKPPRGKGRLQSVRASLDPRRAAEGGCDCLLVLAREPDPTLSAEATGGRYHD